MHNFCLFYVVSLPLIHFFKEFSLKSINLIELEAMCVSSHARRVRTLYKSILRLHRGLPVEIQELGNNYAKGERFLSM